MLSAATAPAHVTAPALGRTHAGEASTSPTLARILQVDDEPDILTIAKLSLETYGGYEVRTCASGDNALAAAQAFAPQLILLDLMMPGTDGLAVMAQLKACAETRDIPVVYLTATLAPDLQRRLIASGAVDVIVKPFVPRALSDKVRQIWQSLPHPASTA
jgi:two-component system, OmpR family, response regulator